MKEASEAERGCDRREKGNVWDCRIKIKALGTTGGDWSHHREERINYVHMYVSQGIFLKKGHFAKSLGDEWLEEAWVIHPSVYSVYLV